ncbi:hypothetical protein HDU77_010323 [Chytriomyces hyalinus]|nr:hypothetical protein HDU77_010323 [Chytriomyces hyalinus]
MNADGISALKKQPVRGILKSHSHGLSDYAADSSANKLKWDGESFFFAIAAPFLRVIAYRDNSGVTAEDNLMMTEVQKDSTMKIDEAKTPYIHYNALTDEIVGHSGAIPPMELSSALDGVKDAQQKMSAGGSASSCMLTSDTESVGSGSGTRSTSGPNCISGGGASGDWDDDEDDSGMKEMTAEEREKHEKFERMRSQHYDMNLKLAAARKQIQDEESGEDGDNDDGHLEVGSDGDDDDYDDESDDEDAAQNLIPKSDFVTESMHSKDGRNPPQLKEDKAAPNMSSNYNSGGSADMSESIGSKRREGTRWTCLGDALAQCCLNLNLEI